ncbi:GNAT family N-acetyltransferase [Pseudooceanicola sp. C21-150M6]|uniref:GNAT family N-acetyltransferase n=1 Tax=Pseudooceanicola sp. C21-150M6 TaxID=3434355 RepID=UPI003D7F5AAD
MTPDDLARIHAASFTTPRPWTAVEFTDLLSSPLVFLTQSGPAFALGRVVAGEAELLTIATDPAERRAGHGQRCLAIFEAEAAARGARELFLEVSAENHAARALYAAAGWATKARRSRYYTTPEGQQIDAEIMGKNLT